jgi:hypothetical protein
MGRLIEWAKWWLQRLRPPWDRGWKYRDGAGVRAWLQWLRDFPLWGRGAP